jgi:SpoVK/Ycf46/Vps4 family AAA+-type ATPase
VAQLKMIQWQLDQHLPRHEPPQPAGGDAEEDANGERLSDLIIRMIEEEDRAADQPSEKSTASADDRNAADPKRDTAEELPSEEERETWLREGLAELDDLIGIESVRSEVRTLVNLCKFQQARQAHSMPTSQLSLHMVFTGNPGTGKTTVARLVGKLFGGLGALKRGHLIETDRSGLVAEYQGQTATKANETIDKALDGVLFIDEAYTLVPSDQADAYGQEAIATLLKRMEDERDRLVVILAGYTEPMDHLLKSNPGLSSRFSRYCDFPDYDTDELCQIFERMAVANHYRMTDAFRAALREWIGEKVRHKDEHFGNGRMVRNEFENAIRNLANRVIAENDLSPDTLSTFTAADLGVAEVAAP